METIIENNKSLSLYPIDYPFESLVSRAKETEKEGIKSPPRLILNPEFQRVFKWDKDGNERASAFIESCLMRIPLPACYFAEIGDGRHEVIDGVQRITTIIRFFNNEFPLEGMSIFTELEGKTFRDLSPALQNDLENTTIRCIVLRKENSKSIVKEIFARLNKGAVSLTPQEIRHAIYPGNLDNLLIKLSKDPIIQNFGLGQNSTPRNGRESEDMVLRFFALNSNLDDYEATKGDNLIKYMDRFMEKHQNITENEVLEWDNLFVSSLEKCTKIFESNVFANVSKDSPRHNMPLYDTLMWSFSQYSTEKLLSYKQEIIEAYNKFCSSEKYESLVSHGVHKSGILGRRKLWESMIDFLKN